MDKQLKILQEIRNSIDSLHHDVVMGSAEDILKEHVLPLLKTQDASKYNDMKHPSESSVAEWLEKNHELLYEINERLGFLCEKFLGGEDD